MSFYVSNILLCFMCVIILANGDYAIFLDKIFYNHDVSDKFLSFAIGSKFLRNFEQFKNLTTNHKLISLARHLRPAYLRIGGNAADCFYFNQTYIRKNSKTNNDGDDISNFPITGETFLTLYNFSQKIGSRIIFDLNVLMRNSDGTWDSTNTEEIISFSKEHNLELDWQLGNEPNSFRSRFNISISPEQLARDYCKLRKILNNSGYQESILVGPEVNHIGINETGNKFLSNFVKKGGRCIQFVTWHQYYLDGKTAEKGDFLNTSVFQRLPEQIKVVKESIKLAGKNISTWISETSAAYGGGAPGLSNRYIDGFLWLDKLGYSARAGIQVVIRQTLFGDHYGLIGNDFEPNPDWWVSVLFKKFVSSRVLSFHVFRKSSIVRLYAHCTSEEIPADSPMVIYGIHLNDVQRSIVFENAPPEVKILSYILTSDDLQSRNIFLNGKILKLQKNGSLPHFHAETLDPGKPVKLPPYSMVFLLINGLHMPGC